MAGRFLLVKALTVLIVDDLDVAPTGQASVVSNLHGIVVRSIDGVVIRVEVVHIVGETSLGGEGVVGLHALLLSNGVHLY